MFTGIVETTGIVLSLTRRRGGSRLVVRPKKRLGPLKKGSSLAVNGACLTLVECLTPGRLGFDVIGETLRLTNLAALRSGDVVNLERALKYGDRLDGHLMLGHVEGKGVIRSVCRTPKGLVYAIAAPKRLASKIFKKGCVAVDGISLTVADRKPGGFSVCIIPHTHASTNLKQKRAGDAVNLETDMMAARALGKR